MFSYLLQETERNTDPEHGRPDLIPADLSFAGLSSESEVELQLVSHQLHLFKFFT